MIKKILGIILLLIGLAMFFMSNYIAEQVLEGRQKIAKAQGNVDTGKKLFSLSPYTKGAGNLATSPVQKKIDAGKQEVSAYDQLAGRLYIGGIVVSIVGMGVIVWGFRGNKKKRRWM
jgi:ABC-type multidrug transport system permease subunit